ncbi:hypothetical protein AMJ85_10015 [candidate division BRC1 bacterium SM23_51]|nr:MAG: hypothetical protein AMJ85_10015 [candidate division BRC1 bacterium SM23_51]
MKSSRRHPFRRWFRLFLVLLILTTVGVSAAVSGLLAYLGTLPPIEALQDYSPPQVTRVVDRTGRVEIARFKRENRVVVALDEIPQVLIQAFLAAEDEHFYEHFGIDFRAVLRALLVNLRHRRIVEGASTIALQLPRNIQETTRERIWKRKLRDAVLALQIERRYSKDQILEFYLNQVYLGSGAYGVKAAARTYFNKDDLHDLALAECALLAGLPRAPSLYSPLRNRDRAKRRRDWVLGRMLDANHIDREVYEKTRREPVRLHPPQLERNRAPYFVEDLKQWLVRDPEFSHEALHRDGYVIRSTLDVQFQEICDEELRAGLREAELKWQQRKVLQLSEDERAHQAPRPGEIRLAEITAVASESLTVRLGGYRGAIALPERLPYYQPDKILISGNLIDVRVGHVDNAAGRFEGELFDTAPIQGAAVVLAARTGEILALSGGYDFYDAATNGQWNRATQAERQAGSCFKPFVYALALESGLTPASVFNDEPVRFPNGYAPKNYERTHFGPTTLEVALEHSRNVVTVLLYQHLLDALGARLVKEQIEAFDVVGRTSWRIAPSDVTVALGSLGITPLELATAYIPFVNQGVALEPICVREVTDADYRPLRRFRPAEKVLLSPATAFQLTHMLRAAVRDGTGRPVHRYFAEQSEREPKRLIPDIGGKTGTTNDCTDAWFAGFTPELVVVVYMGFDSPRTLGPQMTGSYVAAPTWCRIVDRILHTRKDWQRGFAEPPGIEYADVDAGTGLAVAKGQPGVSENVLRRVPFKRGEVPVSSAR